MTRATGVGSMPGEDAAAYAEAVKAVSKKLPFILRPLPCPSPFSGKLSWGSKTNRRPVMLS